MPYQYFLAGDLASICFRASGGGKTLIFVHGFPFDHTSWSPQVNRLKTSFRIVSYDQRGFGRSERGTNDLTIATLADDLACLMDAMHIREAVFCGLSMGGYVLLEFVKKYHDKVKGLILCDTQSKADTEEAKKARKESIQLIADGGKNAFTEKFLSRLFAAATYEKRTDVVSSVHQLMLNTPDKQLMETLEALANRTDNTAVLPTMNFPVLFIAGEEDSITPPDIHKEMQKQVPGSEFVMIHGAGHLCNLEKPDEFNSLVKNFMARM